MLPCNADPAKPKFHANSADANARRTAFAGVNFGIYMKTDMSVWYAWQV